MGIFDSIKSAFSKTEGAPDVTVSPSQLLRDAGIDPSGLKFGFGTGSITVSGDIAGEGDRQKIIDVLSAAPGISQVQDNMSVASPEPQVEEAPPEAPAVVAESEADTQAPAAEGQGRTYTVESGDTLWKIAEQMYGNGSKYMTIFEANKDLLENPDRIFPGQELKIPKLKD